MYKMPQELNTKQDYLNCLQDFPQEAKQRLQALLDNRFNWAQKGILLSADEGLTDETHKVISSEDEHFQLELIEDTNARIFLLGFSVKEVEELLKW